MKKIIGAVSTVVIALILIAQMVTPLTVYADGDTTPQPTDTPAEVSMPEPTETAQESSTPDPMETETLIDEISTPVPNDTLESIATPFPDKPSMDPVEIGNPTLPVDPAESVAEVLVPSESVPELIETALPEETTDELTVAEILEEIPVGTEIVVLDENGLPEPLVTQDAAEIIVTSDPMWCPAGTLTITTACVYAATVTTLLPLLATNDGNGVIYFTPTYIINDVMFLSSNPYIDQLADNTLTIQGGWNGVTSLGSSISYSGNSVFSVPINIIGWNNTVTINNVTVNGAVGSGLGVVTNGADVNINNSSFTNNQIDSSYTSYFLYGDGADVFTNGGNININNSHFDNNHWDGLYTGGANRITITNSTFNGNRIGSGVNAYNVGGLNIGNTNTFTSNENSGVSASGIGSVSIGDGNDFSSNGYAGVSASDTGLVSIASGNSFSSNYVNGVSAYNVGELNIGTNNTFDSNQWGSGVYAYSASGTGLVSIGGGNSFSSNTWDGISAYNIGQLNVVGESSNRNDIAMNGGDGIWAYSVDQLNIEFSNFSNNFYSGINAYSVNSLSVSSSTFQNHTNSDQSASGIVIYEPNQVSISGSTFAGNVFGLKAYVFDLGSFSSINIEGTSTTFDSNTLNDVYLFGPCPNVDNNYYDYYDWVFDQATYDPANYQNLSFLNIPTDWFAHNCPGHLYDGTIPTPPPVSTDPPQPAPAPGDKPSQFSSGGGVAMTPRSSIEFYLSCAIQSSFTVNLPNGDKVEIVCPVSGIATISRVDNTTLPGALPAGYTFASAFQLEISRPKQPLEFDEKTRGYKRELIKVITQGGFIKASFVAPPNPEGRELGILYWEESEEMWIPLKSYISESSFSLIPGDEYVSNEDKYKKEILSGVQFNSNTARVETSTNFPGIYVLVQR